MRSTDMMVLQAVCAVLIADAAVQTEVPLANLDQMAASLYGIAFGLGRSQGPLHMARTVELICQMAEDSPPARNSPEER